MNVNVPSIPRDRPYRSGKLMTISFLISIREPSKSECVISELLLSGLVFQNMLHVGRYSRKSRTK